MIQLKSLYELVFVISFTGATLIGIINKDILEGLGFLIIFLSASGITITIIDKLNQVKNGHNNKV